MRITAPVTCRRTNISAEGRNKMRTSKKLLISACAVCCVLANTTAVAADQADYDAAVAATLGAESRNTLAKIEEFRLCLRTAAANLDDFISPASDIASAAASECAPKWQSVLVASNESLTKMEQYPSQAVRETALRGVLEARRTKLSQPQPSNAKRPPPKPRTTM